MRKLLLVSAFIILGTINSFATHLMGGEITYVHIGGDEYEVTLIVYRDCFGIPVGTSQNVTFESASCGQNFTVVFPLLNTIDVSQVCPGQTTTCNGGTLPGTEQNIYKDTITMTPCSDWIIHWNNGTRNAAISNLVNPDATNIFVRATLNNTIGTDNNSPQYLAIPTPYLCSGQLNIFNHGASDVDGDSIYYELAQPLTTPGPAGVAIPFTAGYTIADPVLTTGGMNLNPTTGEMCFTPSQAQICVVSVLISEFRNGVLIGTQIREMQVVVENNCANQAPFAGSVAPSCGLTGGMNITLQGASVIQTDSNSVVMCPNDSICFTVDFTDPNGDNVTVSSNIASAIPNAVFTVTGNGTPNPVGSFCWVPTPLDSGINILTLSLQDDGCPISAAQYYTYDITVYDQPYAGPDQIICGTQEAQLNASGGGGYVWSVITGDPINVGTNFSCNNCSDPLASPAVTTTYLLTSTQAAACENTDTVTVFVVPDFTPEAYGDTALCDYLTHQIGANITSGPAGIYSFDWNNEGTLNDDTLQHPLASPTGSTWYIVEVESPDGCVKKVDSVQIIVTPPPSVALIPGDVTMCEGESTTFGVSLSAVSDAFEGGFDASMWSSVQGGAPNAGCGSVSGDALYFSGATRELVTNSISTTNCTSIDFCLFIGNANSGTNCENADLGEDVILSYSTNGGGAWTPIQTFLQSDWDANSNWQCFNIAIPAGAQTGATLFKWDQPNHSGGTTDVWAIDDASISCGGNSAYNYSWSPGTNLSATNISDPILSNATTTETYVVTITDTASGCSIDRTQTITVVPNYNLISTQSDTNICLNDTVNFETNPDIAGSFNYTWSPSGIMNNDTINNPTGTFNTPGSQTVFVTVDNGGGCVKMDTFNINVSVGAQPVITMIPDSVQVCDSDPAQLDLFVAGSSLSCQETATATGLDIDAINVLINSFPCVPAGSSVTGIIMDATIGNNCASTGAAWYYYDILINGAVAFTNQCDQTGLDLAAFLPITSVELIAHDDPADGIQDNVTLNLTLNVSYSVNPHSYAWTPNLNLSDSSIKNPTATPPTPTTYYVTVTDTLGGCFDTDSVFVSVGNEVVITDMSLDTSICIYNGLPDSLQLSVQSNDINDTYDWTNGSSLNDSTISNPLAGPTTTTTYSVTVSNATGCTKDTSTTITVFNTNLPITITGNPDYCEGDSTQLSLTGYDTYTWFPNGETSTSIFATSGDYAVNVSLNGCSATSDTLTVNEVIITPPVLLPDSFCAGSFVNIDAGSGYSNYQWSPSGGTGAGAQLGNISIGGNYFVTVDSTVSTSPLLVCSTVSNTILVVENAAPSPQILGDTNYCDNAGAILSVNDVYDNYTWSTGSTMDTTTAYVIGAGPTTITLEVDSNGCTSTTSVIITNPQPFTEILGIDSLCPDTSSTTLSSTNGPFDSYSWSPSGSTTSTTTAIAGTNSLTVTLDGCTYTATKPIYSYPVPAAHFVIAPETSSSPNTEVLFTDASTPSGFINSWLWDFDATGVGSNASGGTGSGPFGWVYDQQGTYTITLTVIDNNGCYNTTTQDYLIFTDIITPNVITPNGDGSNDFLVFQNLDANVFPNNLVVFNRWGNEVFSQTDYQNDWDGGSLSDGTYFFILEVDSNTGKETYKGSLNIFR